MKFSLKRLANKNPDKSTLLYSKLSLSVSGSIPCNTFTDLNPTILGSLNSEQYQYFWKDLVNDLLISQDSIITVNQGQYSLQVYDSSGCYHLDTIVITEDANPIANINGYRPY